MKRALVLLSGAGASLYPILSCALGLGDLQVDSRLNQPLRAHVEISDVTEEEWRQIHARLSQQAESTLQRTTLDSLIFRTTEDASHRHFVEVSSNEPITEPLFDLSIEVAGLTVQVIRNYSVFLDPPGRDEIGSRGVMVAGNGGTQTAASGAGVAAGAASAPATMTTGAADRTTAGADGSGARVAARNSSSRSAARGTSRSTAGRATGANGATGGAAGADGAASGVAGSRTSQQVGLQAGAVYTVVKSDTLERIVRRLGARTAAVRNQQMDWVFEHNPAAFHGSMDRLRAGAQLTLPEQATAANGSSGSAASAVASSGAASGDRALQAQLEGQVSSLQQTLAKMQDTIAAQDAEIAELNRKIATRAEQQRAERATHALATRIAPEVASASDEKSGVGASSPIAATSDDDATVVRRPPKLWEKRATYYWGGALGGAILLAALGLTVLRRRRAAQDEQYQPRYPLVEDSPFRYRATLESPPAAPARQAPQQQPERAERQPSTSGLHVKEEPAESGLESWSTQTALLLSDLPSADDTQPFMMAPHDNSETEVESKRKPSTSSVDEPTAKLQAMETHTVELQTTGELMSPEELEEAELLGQEVPVGPGHGRGDTGNRWSIEDLSSGDDDETLVSAYGESRRAAANEPGPFGPGEGPGGGTDRRGPGERSGGPSEQGQSGRGESGAGSGGGSDRRGSGESRGGSGGQGHFGRGDRGAGSGGGTSGSGRAGQPEGLESAEILEASLNYEPERVDIKLKLLEIYHTQALGSRDNFRSLLNNLAKDARLLSPAQRQQLETLQRTLNESDPDADSSSVAEVAI